MFRLKNIRKQISINLLMILVEQNRNKIFFRIDTSLTTLSDSGSSTTWTTRTRSGGRNTDISSTDSSTNRREPNRLRMTIRFRTSQLSKIIWTSFRKCLWKHLKQKVVQYFHRILRFIIQNIAVVKTNFLLNLNLSKFIFEMI